MTTPRLEDLLARLAPVVREEMLKVCVPNCCVATVAVLRRVFGHFRFEATPVPVSVTIRNAKMVAAMHMGVKIPDDPEKMRAWCEKTGAWSVGIRPESAALSIYPSFGGHLLVRVQDLIVDASLSQANRPQYNILIPPFMAVQVHQDFLRGAMSMVGKVNGCEIIYSRLRDTSWRTSPDWTNERRYRQLVNIIIRRARDGQNRQNEHAQLEEAHL